MLLINLFVFTWIFLLYIDVVFGTDYCKFSPKHMLCGNGSFHPRCGKKGTYIYKNITDTEIEAMLDSHNKYRNELALGKVTGGHNKSYPKAANMEELKWDCELANTAAGMVKKCIFKHHCPYSPADCIQNDRFKYVGENIYSHSSTKGLDVVYKRIKFPNASYAWFFEEKDLYDPSDIPKFKHEPNSLGKCYNNHGHFTQMIWWNTVRVGCAKIGFDPPEKIYKSQIIITCHYAPAGNVMDAIIYEVGKPCSKCSGVGRTCSKKYKGLCDATGRSNDSDPPTTPAPVINGTISYPEIPEKSAPVINGTIKFPEMPKKSAPVINGTIKFPEMPEKSGSFSSRVCISKIVFLLCLLFHSRII